MVTHADVIAEVKSWLGTKYHHQGRVKGAGVDCAGLIIGVAHNLGMSNDVDIKHYPRLPDSIQMKKYLDMYLRRIEIQDARVGDILFLRFATDNPQHLAIISGTASNGCITHIIHSYAQVGKCTEHCYDDVWRKRTVAAYMYKDIL